MYGQYFVNGTRIRAEGPEQMTPEETAKNWNLPLEVVLECIDYCEKNADLLRQEWEEEEADLAKRRAENPVLYPLPPK